MKHGIEFTPDIGSYGYQMLTEPQADILKAVGFFVEAVETACNDLENAADPNNTKTVMDVVKKHNLRDWLSEDAGIHPFTLRRAILNNLEAVTGIAHKEKPNQSLKIAA